MLKAQINILAYAGNAKPSPKLGQSLGPLGINMMQFCKEFNAKTAEFNPDVPMRVRLYAYNDRSYKFLLKPPPTAWFIKRAMGKEKLSNHRSNAAGTVSLKYIYEIAQIKKKYDYDLADTNLEWVCKSIVAQCRGMGVNIVVDRDAPAVIKPPMKIWAV